MSPVFKTPIVHFIFLTLILLIIQACGHKTDPLKSSEEWRPAVAKMDSLYNSFRANPNTADKQLALNMLAELREEHPESDVIKAYSWLYKGFIHKTTREWQAVNENMNKAYELGMALNIREIPIRAAPALLNSAYNLSLENYPAHIVDEVNELASQAPEDPFLIHLALLSRGFYHFHQEDYPAALIPFIQAADFFEQNGNEQLFLSTNNSIALAMHRVGRSEEAINRYSRNLSRYYANNNLVGVSQTLNNLSITLNLMGERQRAVDSLKVALQINEELGLEFNAIQAQYNLGSYLRELAELEESEMYFRESLARSEALNLSMGIVFNSLGLAKNLLMREQENLNLTEIRRLLQLTKDTAVNLPEQDLYIDFALAMTTLESAAGNYQEALRWHKIYQQQYSRIKSTERQLAIEELMFANRLARSEDEIRHLSDVISLKEQAERNLYAGLAVLILLLIGTGAAGIHFRRLSYKISSMYNVLKTQSNKITGQNKELKRLNEERARLTKVIIHDLRNPIGSIDATLEMLEDYPDKELDQFKMFMHLSVRKMQLIVDGLLQVYQTESLGIQDKLKMQPVSQLLQMEVQEFAVTALHKQQTLVHQIDEIQAVTHNQTLHIIVSNLLSNAIKFTPAGKTITLLAENKPGGWMLIVRDEGPGFRESDKAKMFTLFGRLSGKPTGSEQSTGIGLYAVKTAADKLGAVLSVNWDYKEGVEFSCWFPELHIKPEPKASLEAAEIEAAEISEDARLG